MERIELAKKLGWKKGQPVISKLHCFSPFDSKELHHEFISVAAGRGFLFLCDPNWGHREHDQVDALLAQSLDHHSGTHGWLCVPTGGTSGGVRFARHDQATFIPAVEGFQTHFGMRCVNTVGVLPLHHVSGFMAWMRCALTGGTYVDWDWKDLEAGLLPDCGVDEHWVISLVPTQLHRMLNRPGSVEWLRRFRAVILGGAAAWPNLIERAAEEKLPLSLTYGMTETCAMVSASLPNHFGPACNHVGHALPHAQITLGEGGLIRIGGESIFRGYFPDMQILSEHKSEDLGEWDSSGNLVILGRSDSIIISGGKKVSPLEVEDAMLATGIVQEVVVMGIPHPDFGQQVVAFLPDKIDPKTEQTLDALIREDLAPYKRPRRYVIVEPWPRNAQGKVSRDALLASLATHNHRE